MHFFDQNGNLTGSRCIRVCILSSTIHPILHRVFELLKMCKIGFRLYLTGHNFQIRYRNAKFMLSPYFGARAFRIRFLLVDNLNRSAVIQISKLALLHPILHLHPISHRVFELLKMCKIVCRLYLSGHNFQIRYPIAKSFCLPPILMPELSKYGFY